MLSPRYLPLILKQAVRRPIRTLLTMAGVAMAMFLFAAVQSLQEGVALATARTARDTTLVVYQENRFCPASSRLPEVYRTRIEKMPGVVSVMPMKVVPTNCRTSLDVITFRGVPAREWADQRRDSVQLLSGSLEQWTARMDAALISEAVAGRRGLKVGDQFDAAGIRVYIAGILRSDQPQENYVAYTHLDFLQRTTGQQTLGVVTQFNVKVDDPARLDQVAEMIDREFAPDQQPTRTSSEKGFVARAAADIVHVVRFMEYLGWGCITAVLALISNAIVLNVQDRIRDHAVMQTLGYSGWLIGRLVVAEGLLLGVIGGLLGAGLAVAVVRWGGFSLANEGVYIPISATWNVLLTGLAVAAAIGVLASLVPAWRASRREISACFRMV